MFWGLVKTSLLCSYFLDCKTTLRFLSLSVFLNILSAWVQSISVGLWLDSIQPKFCNPHIIHWTEALAGSLFYPLNCSHFHGNFLISVVCFFEILFLSFPSNQKQISLFHSSPFCSFKVEVSCEAELVSTSYQSVSRWKARQHLWFLMPGNA